MKKTLYDILQVTPDASPEVIRSAYESLTKAHNPVLLQRDTANDEDLDRIRNAYEVLSDPVQRAEYDASLTADREPVRDTEGRIVYDDAALVEARRRNTPADLQSIDTTSNLEDQTTTEQEYYKAAVGYRNTTYYLPLFASFDQHSRWASWNWAAFFVSFFWAIYRKMYVAAFVYLIIAIALGLSVAYVATSYDETALIGVSVAYMVFGFIIFPLIANGLYYGKVRSLVRAAIAEQPSDVLRLRQVQLNGGVNRWTIWVFGVLPALILIAAAAMIAYPMYQNHLAQQQIAQGLQAAEQIKPRVVDYYATHNMWPPTLADIGREAASPEYGEGVKQIVLANGGAIRIIFQGSPVIDNKSVNLYPILRGNSVVWVCGSSDLPSKVLPTYCNKS